jgi:hypothetical protein
MNLVHYATEDIFMLSDFSRQINRKQFIWVCVTWGYWLQWRQETIGETMNQIQRIWSRTDPKDTLKRYLIIRAFHLSVGKPSWYNYFLSAKNEITPWYVLKNFKDHYVWYLERCSWFTVSTWPLTLYGVIRHFAKNPC